MAANQYRHYIAFVDGGCTNNGQAHAEAYGSFVVYDITNKEQDILGGPGGAPIAEKVQELFPLLENRRFRVNGLLEGQLRPTNNMAEAFEGADIVYPKSWAPFKAMEERTELYGNGDSDGIKHLEKKLLKQNAEHKDWECTEELMAKTKDGKALYLHCLPADITGVSCEAGEVAATVFDRYRDPLYKQASFKPYIIAAMIFLAKVKDPAAMLKKLEKNGVERQMGLED